MNQPRSLPALREPDAAFLAALTQFLGPGGALKPEDAPGYLLEPRGLFRGRAALIARPRDVEQTAEILRRCNQALVGVVARSGGTGLVGGQTMTEGPAPVLVSFERMNRIRELDLEDDVLIAEAGCVLRDVQLAAEAAGRLFPLSLGAEGSCAIGGNLATNAGGVTVLRYGSARDLCLGVEAALPDGSVLRGLKKLRKDNTGYDLRNLLIGSEGTLGLITAASLKLLPKPRDIHTAMAAVAGPRAAVALLRHLQARLGETVSAFELLSGLGVEFVLKHIADTRAPLAGRHDWLALIDVAGGDLAEPFLAALAEAMDQGLIQDAVVADSAARRAALWRIREETPEANRRVGAVASHDCSTPVSRMAEMVEGCVQVVRDIDPALRLNIFGHIGDGNLHTNVFPPEGGARSDYLPLAKRVSGAIHDLVHRLDGSVSAEHGIGRLKTVDLQRYGDPVKLAAMRAIKAALDPNGIMNPGAVLARE